MQGPRTQGMRCRTWPPGHWQALPPGRARIVLRVHTRSQHFCYTLLHLYDTWQMILTRQPRARLLYVFSICPKEGGRPACSRARLPTAPYQSTILRHYLHVQYACEVIKFVCRVTNDIETGQDMPDITMERMKRSLYSRANNARTALLQCLPTSAPWRGSFCS